jgi:hypothetical protein
MNDDESPPTSDNEDAERLLGSLNYHLGMLGELVPFMVKFDANGPAIVANACLESFLTHARLLIEFIAGRKSSDPVSRKHSAFDFQPSALGLVNWTLTVPTYFDGYLDRIDKHVAHLSRERVQGGGARWWAFEKMARSLLFEYGILADRLVTEGTPQYAIPIKTGISRAEEIIARTLLESPG